MSSDPGPTALYWSQRGEIACRQHAPFEGSDTWVWDDWREVTAYERFRWVYVAGRPMECECCAHATDDALPEGEST